MANVLLIATLCIASLYLYTQTPSKHALSERQSTSATYLLGTQALREGDFKSSKTYFLRLLSIEPHSKDLAQNIFIPLVVLGEVEKANQLIQTYFHNQTSTALMHILRGVHGLKSNNFETLDQLSLEGAPIDSHHIILQYLKILAGLARHDYTSVDALLQNENGSLKDLFLVHKAYLQKNEEDYKSSLSRVLNQAESFSDLTLLLLRSNLPQDKRDPIDQVLSIRNPGLLPQDTPSIPWDFNTLRDMVMIEMIFGFITNPEGISLYLARLFEWLSPDRIQSKLTLAVALKEKGYYARALEILDKIPENSPLAPYKFLTTAETYLSESNVEKTLAIYKNLRERFKSWTLPYLEAAKLLLNNNASLEAMTLLDKGLSNTNPNTPDLWRFYFMRATAFTQESQTAKAEDDLKKALTLDPENPYIMNFLAYSWVDQNKNISQAIELLTKATTLAPDVGAFWDSLGWAYFKNNQIQRGREFVEKALVLSPTDATANDHLGDIYLKLGLPNAAQHQWQKALDYIDEDSDVDPEKIRAKLKR